MLDKTSRVTAHETAAAVSSQDAYWHVVVISWSAVALARRGMVLTRDMRSWLAHACASHDSAQTQERALFTLPSVSCAAAALLPHGRFGQTRQRQPQWTGQRPERTRRLVVVCAARAQQKSPQLWSKLRSKTIAQIFFAGLCPAPRWGSRPRPRLELAAHTPKSRWGRPEFRAR